MFKSFRIFQKSIQYVTCNCNHCSGHIEIDREHVGESVTCPHCNVETLLLPAPKEPGPKLKSEPQKEPAQAVPVTPKKMKPSILGPIGLLIVGIGLIANGCSIEFRASGAMHEIYGAVNYCTGWALVAAAFSLDALRSIAKNQ